MPVVYVVGLPTVGVTVTVVPSYVAGSYPSGKNVWYVSPVPTVSLNDSGDPSSPVATLFASLMYATLTT